MNDNYHYIFIYTQELTYLRISEVLMISQHPTFIIFILIISFIKTKQHDKTSNEDECIDDMKISIEQD